LVGIEREKKPVRVHVCAWGGGVQQEVTVYEINE
jgi:hypothetical protein